MPTATNSAASPSGPTVHRRLAPQRRYKTVPAVAEAAKSTLSLSLPIDVSGAGRPDDIVGAGFDDGDNPRDRENGAVRAITMNVADWTLDDRHASKKDESRLMGKKQDTEVEGVSRRDRERRVIFFRVQHQ